MLSDEAHFDAKQARCQRNLGGFDSVLKATIPSYYLPLSFLLHKPASSAINAGCR